MTIDTKDISLLVLCGGRATRMGGVDKPLVIYEGKPMVDHVIASAPDVAEVIISANRSVEAYASRGRVVGDEAAEAADAEGPLVGILAGLEQCRTPWLLVAPGDTPRLPRNWAERMAEAGAGMQNVVAHDGERQQHLHLLLSKNTAAHLRAYLETGHHEVFRWLEALDLTQAEFTNPAAFTNVNSEADLR